MRTAPCDWPLADVECSALDALDYGLAEHVIEAATSFLWRWTGRRYGVCDVSVRPCPQHPQRSTYRGRTGFPSRWWEPVLVGGRWYNISCDECENPATTIRLPGPVSEVVSVEIDGQPLESPAWRLDNRTLLVRQDGEEWPFRQRMDRPLGDQDTWQVEFRRGVEVPAGGQLAAATLACELAKAVQGDKSCALPQRVRSITREGISTTILDAFEDLDEGRTGLWLVDSWVASVRKAPRRGTVYSPDRHQRTTHE